MFDARRPIGRLFYLLPMLTLAWALSHAQSPSTTTVSDTVFRADGGLASGTLLISWPTFTTASGVPIAAGTTSVNLGSGGALSVALVSNVGAVPANTLYTVVYQLNDTIAAIQAWKKQVGLEG